MTISVIGCGYVGLISGVCLADTGHDVLCIDSDSEKIEKIRRGICVIYENKLPELLLRNLKENRIHFSTELEDALNWAEIIFLALPTPTNQNFLPDTSALDNVIEKIIKWLEKNKQPKIIVIKSTVPPGYTRTVREKFKDKFPDLEVEVCMQPEFLRQGTAIDDFTKPDRIVIGTTSEKVKRILSDIFSPYLRTGNPIIFTDETSAELIKYASNCYLAMRISFINHISHLALKLGANIDDIRMGISLDPRIGKGYLHPGIGFGGSCLPKDLKGLIGIEEKMGISANLFRAVLEINEYQIEYFLSLIYKYYNHNLKNKKIGVWGIAFKANTDDVRESPALKVIDKLLDEGAIISVHDPQALSKIPPKYQSLIIPTVHPFEAIDGADGLIIGTEWTEYRTPDFLKMKKIMTIPVIFDCRNLYNPQKMLELGFDYLSVSRHPIYGFTNKKS